MIKIREALGWLNYGHVTQMTQGVTLLMNVINDPKSQDTTFFDAVNKAYDRVQGSPYPLELPEVLASIGAACCERDDACQAVTYLSNAVELLKSDNHRRAVTAWMLGIAAMQCCDFRKANASWEDACALFSGLANTKVQSKRTWYLERLAEMRRDMAETPQQAYTWLNLFDPGAMSIGVHHIVQELTERIVKRDMTTSYDLIQKLKTQAAKTSTPHAVRAEIYIECGLAAFLLGNPPEAARYISNGVQIFNQHSHQKFVARWMLGAVLWFCEDTRNKAMEAWQECLDEIDSLIQEADYKDRQKEKRWYQEMAETLDWALRDRVDEMQ